MKELLTAINQTSSWNGWIVRFEFLEVLFFFLVSPLKPVTTGMLLYRHVLLVYSGGNPGRMQPARSDCSIYWRVAANVAVKGNKKEKMYIKKEEEI